MSDCLPSVLRLSLAWTIGLRRSEVIYWLELAIRVPPTALDLSIQGRRVLVLHITYSRGFGDRLWP